MIHAPWTLPPPEVLAAARPRFLRRVALRLLREPPADPTQARAWAGVRGGLAELLQREPATLLGALALPQVNAPILAGSPELALPVLLLELARQGKLASTWWAAPVRRLVSPILGVELDLGEGCAGVMYHPGAVEPRPGLSWDLRSPALPELAGLPARRAAWPLRHGGWLSLLDCNPLAMVEAHPDKSGNRLDFGDTSPEGWVAALDEARQRVAQALPALHAEHRGLLGTVLPVGSHPEISTSASYKEAIGQIYLSLHPDPVTMAEALVHETQHNKLNLLAWLDPVLENGDERYPSPVRPDPRPMWGLLLAVHAFLPVEAMHRAWIAASAPWASPRRLAQVRALNHDGMAVLRAYARPTPLGRELIEGLERLEAEMAGQ